MAADTAAPVTPIAPPAPPAAPPVVAPPAPAAPEAPPPAVAVPPAPQAPVTPPRLELGTGRQTMKAAFKQSRSERAARAAAAAANETTAAARAASEPIDTTPPSGVGLPQATTPPAEPRTEPQASTTSATDAPAPTAAPAAPLPATPEPPASPPPVAPTGVPDAPVEDFTSREWQQRFATDPTLKRVVQGIANDPQLSLADKAVRISTKVRQSEDRTVQAQQAQADLRELRQSNPDAYVARLDELDAESEADRQLAVKAGRFMAHLVDADPDDADFLAAGPQPGESPEVGLDRMRTYLAERAPVVRASLDAQARQFQAANAQAVEALKAEHTQALEALRTELNTTWQQKYDADLAQARAEEAAGRGGPPRVRFAPPGSSPSPLPTDRSEQTRLTRGLLSGAFAQTARMRDGATAET